MTLDQKKLQDKILEQERLAFPTETPQGFIQYKGTNICIDLICKCGYRGHYDGDFLYYYRCPKCNTVYQLSCRVKLYELSEEESKHTHIDIKTCELE